MSHTLNQINNMDHRFRIQTLETSFFVKLLNYVFFCCFVYILYWLAYIYLFVLFFSFLLSLFNILSIYIFVELLDNEKGNYCITFSRLNSIRSNGSFSNLHWYEFAVVRVDSGMAKSCCN